MADELLDELAGTLPLPADSAQLRAVAAGVAGHTVVLEAAQDRVRVSWLPAPWLPADRVEGYQVVLRDRTTGERRTAEVGAEARDLVVEDLPVDHEWVASVAVRSPDAGASADGAEPVTTRQGQRLAADPAPGAEPGPLAATSEADSPPSYGFLAAAGGAGLGAAFLIGKAMGRKG